MLVLMCKPLGSWWGLDSPLGFHSVGWSREIKPHMFEHLPKQRDLAGKEGGVSREFWQRSERAPTSVFTEGEKAAGSTGTGAWARLGAHSHSTPRAVRASKGIQFSV